MAAIETESQGELRQLSGVLFIKDHIKREWRLYDKRGNNHWYRTSLSNETIQSLHPFLSNYRGGDETKILIHPLVILLPLFAPPARRLKKNTRPTEDLDSVIQRLSVFGPIKSVSLRGRQSAVVVFEHTVSACSTVNAFRSRTPGTMFQCAWQQRFIAKDVRLPITKNLRKFSKLVSHRLFFIRALVK